MLVSGNGMIFLRLSLEQLYEMQIHFGIHIIVYKLLFFSLIYLYFKDFLYVSLCPWWVHGWLWVHNQEGGQRCTGVHAYTYVRKHGEMHVDVGSGDRGKKVMISHQLFYLDISVINIVFSISFIIQQIFNNCNEAMLKIE